MHSPFWNPEPGPSIGMACNIYNDVNAVAGLLQTASTFFDDMVFFHAGPQGKRSDDGTIELIEKWGAKIVFGKIDEGFGIVRSAAIKSCPTEWVMILDADERFWPQAPLILPHGEGDGNIHIQFFEDAYDQGALLRRLVRITDIDTIYTIRRHWNDFSWKKPVQNWHTIPDYQCRIVRNLPHIGFRAEVRMHEQMWDFQREAPPRGYRANSARGIFHDHYHCWFKKMERDQRAHDIAIFDAIHENRVPPTELTPEERASIDLRIHHT